MFRIPGVSGVRVRIVALFSGDSDLCFLDTQMIFNLVFWTVIPVIVALGCFAFVAYDYEGRGSRSGK